MRRPTGGAWVPAFAMALALASAAAMAAPQLAGPVALGEAPPVLSSNTTLATAGYFQLRWRPATAGTDAGRNFELEQRGAGGLRRWRIEHYRRFEVSGLGNGEYEYRVRRLRTAAGTDTGYRADAWSEPVRVTVEHHSLSRAWGFFAVGLAIFSGLVGVVVAKKQQ